MGQSPSVSQANMEWGTCLGGFDLRPGPPHLHLEESGLFFTCLGFRDPEGMDGHFTPLVGAYPHTD